MMFQEIKNTFLMLLNELSYIEIAIFLGLFVLFVLLFVLALNWYYKRFLPAFFVLLAFLALFSPPFVIEYVLKDYVYKLQVSYNRASPMAYADSFLIDMDVKNIGKKTIHKCLVEVNTLRHTDSYINRFRNLFYSEKTFRRFIDRKIPVGKTEHFMVLFDNFYLKKNPYKTTIDCF